MIYVTGDIHSDINRFNDKFIPGESALGENDYILICGDFGFIFRNDDKEKALLDELERKPYKILWIDGNHENFNALSDFPVEEWNGGKVHRIRTNILHLLRGQIFTIEGKTFFTMGGAYSPDRYMRIKNFSYWAEELPDNNEYKEAIENLKKHGNKVDYILTHTAPKEIILRMGYHPDPHDAELTGFLEWIMYECEYTHWFFGHFHEDRNIGEKFTALLFDSVKII